MFSGVFVQATSNYNVFWLNYRNLIDDTISVQISFFTLNKYTIIVGCKHPLFYEALKKC